MNETIDNNNTDNEADISIVSNGEDNEMHDTTDAIEDEMTEMKQKTKQTLQMSNDEVMNMIEAFEKVKEENITLKDDMLRSKADMENTKKRLIKYYEEQSKHKTKQLLLDIVGMLDDFERAMSAGNEGDSDGLIEGIKLIETQFIKTLENKWRVVRFDAKNVAFDPEKHEAMMSEETEGITESMVLDEFSKGYCFEDKVLRTAKVKVGTPKITMGTSETTMGTSETTMGTSE